MTEYIRSLTKNSIVLPSLPEKTLPAAGWRPQPRRNIRQNASKHPKIFLGSSSSDSLRCNSGSSIPAPALRSRCTHAWDTAGAGSRSCAVNNCTLPRKVLLVKALLLSRGASATVTDHIRSYRAPAAATTSPPAFRGDLHEQYASLQASQQSNG